VELKKYRDDEQRLSRERSELLKLIDPTLRVERDKLLSDRERTKEQIERLQKKKKITYNHLFLLSFLVPI